MITIYALRVRGDREVRYVGQSADTEQRLAGHLGHARAVPWPTHFALWLNEHGAAVEIVPLRTADTREEARIIERETVAIFLALDHRLFNQWLVPAEKRQRTRENIPLPRWMKAA